MEHRYSAFLSYSRRDEAVGSWLERALQGYRIPKAFRPIPERRKFNIFRDVHDAELGDYSHVIETALRDSGVLILLCSPASRASAYVAGEIETFIAIHGHTRVIPVLVDGRPNKEVAPDDPVQDQAFPDLLYDYFDEPIAADFRSKPGEGFFARRKRRHEALFQIIAKLLNQPKSDELVRRDRHKRRLVVASVASIGLITAVYGSWMTYDRMPKSGLDPLWKLFESEHDERTRLGLDRLERALAGEVPQKGDGDRLLIGTWNIREFARRQPPHEHARSEEAFSYIAMILSAFDVVAVQEMRGKTNEFEAARNRLLGRLGTHWAYAGSGVTEGNLGNRERLGFFYDRRSVQRSPEMDEVVLPDVLLERVGLERQIARTPLIAGFYTDAFKIALANAHIYYGSSQGDKREIRLREFTALVKYLRSALDGGRLYAGNAMLLGDLNVDRPDAPELQAATEAEFHSPGDLHALPTNMAATRPYDQILFSWNPETEEPCVSGYGVFSLFDKIYRDDQFDAYLPDFEKQLAEVSGSRTRDPKRYYRIWKSYQLSDHSPKWVQLDTECKR